MKFKRLVAVGDAHSGHRVGLASPKFQSAIPGEQFWRIQVELWDYFQFHINELKKDHPIDILVHNGDAIDGPGGRSGGSELITTDCNRQIDIAYDALKIADAGNYFFTYGTAYHTGQDTDFEKVLADRFNGIIRSHLWLDVNGTTFDIKHHIGNSSVPYGKGTPLAKEWMWNTLWNLEQEQQPKADVYIRSHVHNFALSGGADWIAMTLPALQGQGSKFGARRCSQIVHFGLVWFDCYEDGSYIWSKRLLVLESQKQIAIKV